MIHLYEKVDEIPDILDQKIEALEDGKCLTGLDIVMADESGTLAKVTTSLFRFGLNVVKSRTETLEKGKRARFKVCVDRSKEMTVNEIRAFLLHYPDLVLDVREVDIDSV